MPTKGPSVIRVLPRSTRTVVEILGKAHRYSGRLIDRLIVRVDLLLVPPQGARPE
jgi:hypothetical protein